MNKPGFFDRIASKAEGNWNYSEANDLTRSQRNQLFRQILHPRHVVSELLQNADDAGATKAEVVIRDDQFIFRHNGTDFSEEEFESLCQFAFSNKRKLNTIGFRGMGFKSTFSLGEKVYLSSSSLGIEFLKSRFFVPVWNGKLTTDNYTEIRIPISDSGLTRKVEENLEEWRDNPYSLLFFNYIKGLSINGKECNWEKHDDGPVKGMYTYYKNGDENRFIHVIRSDELIFPDEAIEEIRKERDLPSDENLTPTCRIQIVTGIDGKFFVILPTNIKTDLPFAVNAPFIQDPARNSIKEPELSPTNLWLLEQAGILAGNTLQKWLSATELSISERANAYDLLPDVDRSETSLEGSIAIIVEKTIENIIREEKILLTESGELVNEGNGIDLSDELRGVWKPDYLSELFDPEHRRPLIAEQVNQLNREKLRTWSILAEIDNDTICERLRNGLPNKPSSWKQLLNLWLYLDSFIYWESEGSQLRIFPVNSIDNLYASDKITRLQEQHNLKDDDWQFLSDHLIALDMAWVRYIWDRQKIAREKADQESQKDFKKCLEILNDLELGESTSFAVMIDKVSKQVFNHSNYDVNDYVRLSQIAARLKVRITEEFAFLNRHNILYHGREKLIADPDGEISELTDPAEYSDYLLSDVYTENFRSCTSDEWKSWILSPNSGLSLFIPLDRENEDLHHINDVKSFLRKRGSSEDPGSYYSNQRFKIIDRDFPDNCWQYWHESAVDDTDFWARLGDKILSMPSGYWDKRMLAEVIQISGRNKAVDIINQPVRANWVIKLSEYPILRDTNKSPRTPGDLMRRTRETDELQGTEAFLDFDLDTNDHNELLDLLGVRSGVPGPEKILDRIMALSETTTPPIAELLKWYKTLDQILNHSQQDVLEQVQNRFVSEKLIFTQSGEWEKSTQVYITADDSEVADMPVINKMFSELRLWPRIGVQERPTAEAAITYIQSLEPDINLNQTEQKRVKNLLGRYPLQIWDTCGLWLSLGDCMVSTSSLKYQVSMSSLIKWEHLFVNIKKQVADFRLLTEELLHTHPFSSIPTLRDSLKENVASNVHPLGDALSRPWLETFGNCVRRIRPEENDGSVLVRNIGEQLVNTKWQKVINISVIPYLNGTPAGRERNPKVFWQHPFLYMVQLNQSAEIKLVTDELDGYLALKELKNAIRICADRSPEFILDYFEENFELLDEEFELDRESHTAESSNCMTGEQELENHTNDSNESLNRGSTINEQDDINLSGTDSSNTEDEDLENGIVQRHRRTGARTTSKPLIERYAASRGFRRVSNNLFQHADESRIEKVLQSVFPWTEYSFTGQVAKKYWDKELCLEHHPLELPAEVWKLIEGQPELYSLILTGPDQSPKEWSGMKLLNLNKRSTIALYPASYRIQLNNP